MKIFWLQDFDIFNIQGGAEMNDKEHFKEGIKRNHDLDMLYPSNVFVRPDLLIISNCVIFDKKRLSDMCAKTPHVFFFHDYIFCKYRLFFPLAKKCDTCISRDYWLSMFKTSKLIIYLSPLHKYIHEEFFPELKEVPSVIVPSAIRPGRFTKTYNVPRQPFYLSVHGLLDFKGKNNLLDYMGSHPYEEFHVIHPDPNFKNLPGNCKIIPPMRNELMPELYHKYDNYIELPDTPQPFNRTVCEAKLSGCKVITNGLMGAASFDWFNNTKLLEDNLRNAPKLFWDSIERAV